MRSQVKVKQQRKAKTQLRQKKRLFSLIFLAGAAVALLLGWSIVQFSISASATQTNKKQAMLQHMQQMRIAALAATKPSKNPNWRPSPSTPEAWATGIVETNQAPFPADSYTISNQWQEVVGGKHLIVYAGSEGQDASQGLVIVMTWSLDLQTVTGPHVYITRSHSGALRITGVSAQHLTLTSTSGVQFVFFVAPVCAMNQPTITGSECQLLPASTPT